MKYLLKVLIILLVIFGLLKLVIHLFNDGHKISYSVGNFEVDETLETKALYNTDYYYFNIIHEDFKMNFSVPVNYNKAEKIISSIKYQNIDGMNCIMPVFKGGKLLTDIMCVKNSNITFYHDLSDNYKNNLNKFVKSLEKYNYNPSIYELNLMII